MQSRMVAPASTWTSRSACSTLPHWVPIHGSMDGDEDGASRPFVQVLADDDQASEAPRHGYPVPPPPLVAAKRTSNGVLVLRSGRGALA